MLKKTYHSTVSDQLSEQHKGVLVSVDLEKVFQIMDQLWPNTGNPLAMFFGFLYILLLSCLPNVSHKYYHDKKSDQYSAQNEWLLVSFSW